MAELSTMTNLSSILAAGSASQARMVSPNPFDWDIQPNFGFYPSFSAGPSSRPTSEHGQFGRSLPARPCPMPGLSFPIGRTQRHSLPDPSSQVWPGQDQPQSSQSPGRIWQRPSARSEGAVQQVSQFRARPTL